jgi:cytoskeleton protein RodZ
MIENSQANADESQPIKDLSPGSILLQARLQTGLTQEQVAKELYMTISKVKALETDDYSRLSSDTFARGYIRAYANLVKVDVIAVLTAYDGLMESLKPASAMQNPVTTTAEMGQRGTWQFLIVIAAFLVGLWLISVWFFDNHSEPEYSAPDASVPTATLQTHESVASSSLSNVAAPSVVGTKLATDVRSPVEDAGNPNLAAPVSSSPSVEEVNTISTAAQTNVDVNEKKNSLDEISFSFRAECWLEVSDSRGDVLATELEPAGGKIKLLGRAPFNVKLGNAPAADIELNGKKIDVVPLIGSNVLILKVGN